MSYFIVFDAVALDVTSNLNAGDLVKRNTVMVVEYMAAIDCNFVVVWLGSNHSEELSVTVEREWTMALFSTPATSVCVANNLRAAESWIEMECCIATVCIQINVESTREILYWK